MQMHCGFVSVLPSPHLVSMLTFLPLQQVWAPSRQERCL